MTDQELEDLSEQEVDEIIRDSRQLVCDHVYNDWRCEKCDMLNPLAERYRVEWMYPIPTYKEFIENAKSQGLPL